MFKIVPIDIYSTDILVSVGQSDDELLERLGLEPEVFEELFGDFNKCVARTSMHDDGWIIIRLKDLNDVGVIAHEVFHSVCYLMRRVGIKHSFNSEEAFAYLIQYILNQIIKDDQQGAHNR
jgi:hypothetical protein